MKKCFCFLFPEESFFNKIEPTNKLQKYQLIDQFNYSINKRYAMNGWDILVISFKNSKVYGLRDFSYKVLEIPLELNDVVPNKRVIDWWALSKTICECGYQKIAVGGFFLRGGVHNLACCVTENIYGGYKCKKYNSQYDYEKIEQERKIQKEKVIVDLDLTDKSWEVTRDYTGKLSKNFSFDCFCIEKSMQTYVDNNLMTLKEFEQEINLGCGMFPHLFEEPYHLFYSQIKYKETPMAFYQNC